MAIQFFNNAFTTLAGSISNTATTANLATGTGSLFPLTTGNYFCMTFIDAATGLLDEIIHVTNVSGDTITIVRAQEGTSALNWLAGDLAQNLWTAGSATALVAAPSGLLLNIQKFQTPGTFTYVPTTGTNSVIVMVQAGGGGGAGCIINNAGPTASIGTPGGGGAFGSSRLTSGFSGITVTVGGGGTGGTGSSNGSAGGNSSFGTLLVCTGGYYGSPGASASVGTSGGQGNVVGQTGANLDSRYGGLGTQSFVYRGVNGAGGAGGSSFYGDGAAASSTNTNGFNAGNFGGGGGGTCGDSNSATTTGGNGAGGKVEIWEYT